MIRVYVAGTYSADNPIDVFENMRNGMVFGTKLLLAGFAPIVPWFDYHFFLMLREDEKITYEQIYQYSEAMVEASEAVIVISGHVTSVGVQREIKKAQECHIPVYYALDGFPHHKALEKMKREILHVRKHKYGMGLYMDAVESSAVGCTDSVGGCRFCSEHGLHIDEPKQE